MWPRGCVQTAPRTRTRPHPLGLREVQQNLWAHGAARGTREKVANNSASRRARTQAEPTRVYHARLRATQPLGFSRTARLTSSVYVQMNTPYTRLQAQIAGYSALVKKMDCTPGT